MSEKQTKVADKSLITDLLIAELDFTPELPCEIATHPVHHLRNECAHWKIQAHCPNCHWCGIALGCNEAEEEIQKFPFTECHKCGVVLPTQAIFVVTPI